MVSSTEDYTAAFSAIVHHTVMQFISGLPVYDPEELADDSYLVHLDVEERSKDAAFDPLDEVFAFRDRLEQSFIKDGAQPHELPLIIGGRVKDTGRKHLMQILVMLPPGQHAIDHLHEASVAMFGVAGVTLHGTHSLAYSGQTSMQALREVIAYQAKSWLAGQNTRTFVIGNREARSTEPLFSRPADTQTVMVEQ